MKAVIVNCFDTYGDRVELLRKTLVEKGFSVEVFTSDYKHIEKIYINELREGYRYFHAQPYTKNLSMERLKSHQMLSREVFSYLDKNGNDIDLLWVLLPPNTFAKDAAEIKRKHKNIKLIFDLIDLWPETMPIPVVKNLWPITVWGKIRDDNLNTADYIVTECDLYQKVLNLKQYGVPFATLYLAKEKSTQEIRSPQDDGRLSLCYLGSINNIIDIDAICSIIRQAEKKYPVDLHIIGDGEKREELISRTKLSSARVFYHGKIYDEKGKQDIFNQCHYGLNIMKKSVCVGLTMKSLDYLSGGLPIINNIKGDTWDSVEKYSIGINYPEEIILKDNEKIRRRVSIYFDTFLSRFAFEKSVSQIIEGLGNLHI